MRIRPERIYTCALCCGNYFIYHKNTRGNRPFWRYTIRRRQNSYAASADAADRARPVHVAACRILRSIGMSLSSISTLPVCMSACPVLRELISCNNGLRTIREGAQRDCPLGRECAERSPASEKRQVEGQAAQRRPRNCGRPRRRVRPQSASRRRPAVLCFCVCARTPRCAWQQFSPKTRRGVMPTQSNALPHA